MGPGLYTFCFFRSPGPIGLHFLEPLVNDGRGRDAPAGDGTFTAAPNLEAAQRWPSLTSAMARASGRRVVVTRSLSDRTHPREVRNP